MKRYIALAAATLLVMSGCGKKDQEPSAPVTEAQPVAEISTEDTTESDIPESVKITTADVRTYCVSIDAARNAYINKYNDKIPEKLRPTFDANSDVLDDYMDKAAKDLTDEEIEQLFNNLKNLETFFCVTMAEEMKLGDEIEQVALAATKGADYYFEKVSEEAAEETSEDETDEDETDEDESKDEDSDDKDSESDKDKKDGKEKKDGNDEKSDSKTDSKKAE